MMLYEYTIHLRYAHVSTCVLTELSRLLRYLEMPFYVRYYKHPRFLSPQADLVIEITAESYQASGMEKLLAEWWVKQINPPCRKNKKAWVSIEVNTV